MLKKKLKDLNKGTKDQSKSIEIINGNDLYKIIGGKRIACPKLTSCDTNYDDCPVLEHCGTNCTE